MLPPVIGDADALAAEALGVGQQRRDAGGTGAFGHHLGTLGQQADRLLDRALRHHQHLGAEGADDGQRHLADVAHGDALGDGRRRPPTPAAPASRCAMRGIGRDLDADTPRCPASSPSPRPRSRRAARRRRPGSPARRGPARPAAVPAPACPARRSPPGRRRDGRTPALVRRPARRACAAASASVSPCSTTCAPQAAVRVTFVARGEFRHHDGGADMPSSCACRATACAWLPADIAMTPRCALGVASAAPAGWPRRAP